MIAHTALPLLALSGLSSALIGSITGPTTEITPGKPFELSLVGSSEAGSSTAEDLVINWGYVPAAAKHFEDEEGTKGNPAGKPKTKGKPKKEKSSFGTYFNSTPIAAQVPSGKTVTVPAVLPKAFPAGKYTLKGVVLTIDGDAYTAKEYSVDFTVGAGTHQ